MFITRLPVRKPQIRPQPNLVDISHLIGKMRELENAINSVSSFKEEIKKQHDTAISEMKREHAQEIARVKKLQTVNKGDPGKDAQPLDEKVIEERIFSRIPKPKDGQSPIIDEEKIAQKVIQKIPMPKDGKDGSVDVPKFVDMIIEAIQKGKKLKTEHIDGFENSLSVLRNYVARGSVRGGGDVVAAGSNITITKNANGNKVISSTGGSGFTALAATETPNGSITVFTFSTATAQPSYLVVDNVWLKATTKSGTVNWTWNNGTKQATLTIPPNDDIWGVV